MYIHKKSNTYHYRIAIPNSLKPYTSRKELWLTLRTADRSLAYYKANIIAAIFRSKFNDMLDKINHKDNSNLSYLAIKDMVKSDLNASIREIKSKLELLGPLNFSQINHHESNIARLRSVYQQDIIPEDEESELVAAFCQEKNINPTAREKLLIQRELIKALVCQEKAKVEMSKSFHREPEVNLSNSTASGAFFADSDVCVGGCGG